MSSVTYIVFAGACIALGLFGKPTMIAVGGILSVLLLAVLSAFSHGEIILFLFVPITASCSMALLRGGRADTRTALGLGFAPLFGIVTLTVAVLIFLAGLLVFWRGNLWPRFWATVVSMLPTCCAVLIFVRQQV